ncbi:uncharacterized protein LOC129728677 [Wyeomyia smithii]|uniref:uncharacterized protein LOC129728677 n=1 Tax=Wyeomyia smithii TaxID=174621 RepID=UPI0024681718|nr:uncharacterized protein LOC129728677 [Wyeomyia smithii]
MGICLPEATVDTTHTQSNFFLHKPHWDSLPATHATGGGESITVTTTPVTGSIHCPTKSSFTFYYQNVRGLRTNIEDLFLATTSADYDIIVLTETWLNDEINSVQLFGDTYAVYRNDRDAVATRRKRGGGVLIAVSTKLRSSRSSSRVDNSIEHLWVNVYGSDNTIAVGVVYIAPDFATDATLIEKHIESATNISNSLRPCDYHLLFGDYNQPNLVWTSSPSDFLYADPSESRFSVSGSALVDGMALLNMKQINDIRNIRDRTWDLIFINAEIASECIVSEAVEPLLQTDAFHPALVCNLNCSHTINYNDITNDMKFDFRKADFVLLDSAIASLNWSRLLESDIDKAVETYTSQLAQLFRQYVPLSRPRRKPPWSNGQLRELKRLRAAALRRYTNCRSLFEKHHFSGVFSAEPANEQSINLALGSVPRDVIDITTFLFTVEEVRTAIRKIKSSVVAGPDGIPSIVLKLCAESIATPLTIIFNASLSQAKFPEMWKQSFMFPIHKKGDKRDVGTYRGITSLCTGSKLFEILVGDVLFAAIRSYISPAQHGFFKGRSIDTNLAEFSSLCIKAMEDGNQIDTIYTDLKAAFDRVDHQLLLTKIER